MSSARATLLFNVNVAWFFTSHRLPVARAALNAGFDVHVAADIESEEEVSAITDHGITFHRVRISRGGLSPPRDLRYLRDVSEVIRRVRPDILHNVTVKPVVYGSVAARILRVPSIVNAISGLGYSFSGERSRRLVAHLVSVAYRFALRGRSTTVIFQNGDDMEAFISEGIIERGQAVMIRGSGADLKEFSYSTETAGKLKVVLPARMLREKGVVEFAEAAESLRRAGWDADFILAGRSDDANPGSLSLEELDRLQKETGVRWVGHVSDMPELFRTAHVVCLPSYREGLPKALIEACATGRPIVTTDVPGCREVVIDGLNGLLVKPRAVASLARALERLLADRDLRATMGKAGRLRAETEFGLESVVRQTLELYGRMLR